MVFLLQQKCGWASIMRYPVGFPSITEREIFEVTGTMRDGNITQGAAVQRFEQLLSEYLQVKHVVVCSSGTSALHLALATLCLEPGDEVLVPNVSFVATANAVKYVGATPVLVDIDPHTWNISLADAISKMTIKTKAILPVHLYGVPCDMKELMEFAEDYNLFVIEDAAEAFGGNWGGQACGTFGLCGTFSFYANKIITTGEGGAVVTNDDDVACTLRSLRGQAQSPIKRYFHTELGYNYRLTDIQASIGIAQLRRIENFLIERYRVVGTYANLLGTTLLKPTCSGTAPWMYTGLLPITSNYLAVEDRLKRKGIEVRPVFVPMNRLPMYLQADDSFPVSSHVGDYGISLPTYPTLQYEDIQYIASSLLEAL